MPGISFADEANADWIVPGWIFRCFLEDLRRQVEPSADIVAALTSAEHIGFMVVSLLEESTRSAITSKIRDVCSGLLGGALIPSIREEDFYDKRSEEVYLSSIQRLLACARFERADQVN